MKEELLYSKIEEISDKLNQLESLFSRRLLEDKVKNALIDDLTSYLLHRQELDNGQAYSSLMKDILGVNDRLEKEQPTYEFNQSVSEELVHILGKYGLYKIENTGVIDPKIHEVVGLRESYTELDGEILEVISQGYSFKNKILRPTKVIVAKRILTEETDEATKEK